ncbi:hypothetical protein [Mucilaginibacter sp. L3T2-6]|uniref:hypothetical protein n=1 Tax=Mucilaginibacter sp. L3T2-6 TaxID=3062491 RepID=UPI002676428F|nr:hypothetical protein [Mucilaginibacter sp. L3T2-6]MDO3645039.1 hypothetical protein [Mucilaginibacter sp. L3T2-6]MDV6217490.1 hypothetical protein [Mucilaginibacter sp. L3T2-6]
MKVYFLPVILLLLVASFAASAQTVMVSASEPDATIIVDGQSLGTGNLKVKVPKNSCVNVKVQKAGFLKYEQTYCNKKGQTEPPKKQFFDMKRDDAEEASVKTDQANIDFSIEVNKKQDPVDVWKRANQVVTDYFDAIEVSDKETSYLRTAWSVQSFQQNTIRTRLIIKLAKSEPLTYKVKLVSEYSGAPLTSVKADEQFHDWDRILRKYQNVISDFTTRLGNQ